jgi:hypothetical protein
MALIVLVITLAVILLAAIVLAVTLSWAVGAVTTRVQARQAGRQRRP